MGTQSVFKHIHETVIIGVPTVKAISLIYTSPVLSFDVFWSPAPRWQQNDQLWEHAEVLTLAFTINNNILF